MRRYQIEHVGGTTEEDLHDTANLVGEYAGAIEIVQKAAAQSFSPTEREGLVRRLSYEKPTYNLRQAMVYYERKVTIHDIAEPLAKIIEVLENDVDSYAAFAALSEPPYRMASPAAEREMLLQLLRKLRDNLPSAPAKRSRGKPPAGDDLYRLVERLADIWERYTGKEFTRLWHEGEPLSEAMRFTCAVVKVIDKDRLDELPTVTKNVCRKRRQAAQ
jgi:hypothetical protein